MSVAESIDNKRSEDVTGEDVRGLLNSPPDDERPLVEAGIFNERQPVLPIYKNIPLKFLLVSIVALIGMVPVMMFFAGNLLGGEDAAVVAPVENLEETETEEEKEQRLTAEENANLKRSLALQNQSFTAQEIEDAEAEEGLESGELAETASLPPAQSAPAPIARPATPAARPSAPASRPATPAPRPATVARSPYRSTPAPRAASPARSTATPVVTAPVRAPEPEPLNIARVAAAGNYGEMPSRSNSLSTKPTASPVVASSQIPVGIQVSNLEPQFSRTGSIPISVRRQGASSTQDAYSTVSETFERPMPTVMQDEEILTVAAVSEPVELASDISEEVELYAANTYEEQRNLIMGETAVPSRATNLPARILPGSAAQLEVKTTVTWASDMPKALGAVVLTSPLLSDGAEVIPEGTELMVQIGALSDSGAVSLDVVSMVLPDTAKASALNIPDGALEILAVDGGYPVAKAEQSSERQLRVIDRQQALLSAMGSAGDYLNRPERETNVFGPAGSSSSREYGSGSFFGSLLSGAANGILRSRAARLNEEADKILERPTIWSIESGRELQLFVTQEISL